MCARHLFPLWPDSVSPKHSSVDRLHNYVRTTFYLKFSFHSSTETLRKNHARIFTEISSYFIISGVLQLMTTFYIKDTILITKKVKDLPVISIDSRLDVQDDLKDCFYWIKISNSGKTLKKI